MLVKYALNCSPKIKLEKRAKETRSISISGKELHDRFISSLEQAGLNPYLFNEGLMSDTDTQSFTEEECLALGVSEAEFEARSQKS